MLLGVRVAPNIHRDVARRILSSNDLPVNGG